MRKKRKHQKGVRAMVGILLVLWTVFGVIGLFTVAQRVFGMEDKSEVEADTRESQEQRTVPEIIGSFEETAGSTEENPKLELTEEEQAECKEIYENHPELLVLVNKEHELDESYDPKLRTICNGRLEASDRMYQDLTKMLHAAGDAGYEYWIASAYRSRQRQQELIDEDVETLMEKGWSYEDALEQTLRETMPAGYSEHETGLALDILCSGNMNMDDSQANEPGNQWLVEHCSEYGFILRYPKDKETVTGIDYEPWHFRYVGRDAAVFIMEHNLTLEDFLNIYRNDTLPS